MMKRTFLGLMAALAFLISAPTHAAEPEDVTGDWIGSLQTPGGALRLVLTVMKDDGGLKAVLESPDQAPGQKIPVASITVADGTMAFEVKVIGASYTGKWADDHWQGTFRQGIDMPLDLKRGALEAKPVVTGLDGAWAATISRGGQDIAVTLKVTTGNAGTSASFDIPGQMAYGLPVTDVKNDAGAVHFFVPAANAAFDGSLDGDSKNIKGIWSRAGNDPLDVTFTYQGEKLAARKRPQLPKEPFPYAAEEVLFENPDAGGIKLAGTLTVPAGKGPFPAAILISGSGPQDRDETIFEHKPFAVIADYLTRRGIAVLRYDDRGFGASGGDYSSATSADFASDANAAHAFLSARPDINAHAIGMIGHSEGGMIAPIAARSNKRIAFMVLLAGPGTPTLQLLADQRRLIAASNGVPAEKIAETEALLKAPLDAVYAAKNQADARAALETLLTPEVLAAAGAGPAQKQMVIQQFSTNWFLYFLHYDPAGWVPALEMPVLALGGTKDIQVPAQANLTGLMKLLAKNPDMMVQPLDGLNHMFQHANTGALGEYIEIEETFAPSALTLMGDWIKKRF